MYNLFKTIEETNSFSTQQIIEYIKNELNKLLLLDENKISIIMHISHINKKNILHILQTRYRRSVISCNKYKV